LKKLPYKTIYLEFPDIAPVLQKANVPPITKQDGTLGYTCPSIVDDTTGTAISDSFKIAEYLDTQYPETPKAFPLGSIALQAVFYARFSEMTLSLVPLIVTKTPGILNPVSAEYFHCEIRPLILEVMSLDEEREQLWRKAESVFDWLDGLYSMSGGPFFMGEAPSFADFVLGGVLEEMKILGDWDKITVLNGGRWKRLVMDLEKYASTEK
jgi:glutathione S-transferase